MFISCLFLVYSCLFRVCFPVIPSHFQSFPFHMTNFEALLEFEHSLSTYLKSSNRLMLSNLESRIEYASQFCQNQSGEEEPSQSIEKLFDDYNTAKDDFTTCGKCGTNINTISSNTCCKTFLDTKKTISSDLEMSYWTSFLSNPSQTINSFPSYTQLLFLQQGIPFQLRGPIWKRLLLLNNSSIPQTSLLVYENFQHSYSADISTQISKDLSRTFPDLPYFKQEKTLQNLSTILNVYANYDAELGYCQGLLFLVGVLSHQFKDDPQLVFHALLTIMETEKSLHDIFTPQLMSHTLQSWNDEFQTLLKTIDGELYRHLNSFVEFQVFLYQWWLSFLCSHSPDMNIVNRVIDFCLLEGWKTGIMKISLGLLIANKPILMSLQDGDEEVAYQHLLNECKWGVVVNDVNSFFGDLLLSWDERIFEKKPTHLQILKTHKRSTSMMDKFKSMNLSINLKPRSNSTASDNPESAVSNQSQSSLSVFSSKVPTQDMDSIYSDMSSQSDFVPFKFPLKKDDTEVDDLTRENINLKCLLQQALLMLGEEASDLRERAAEYGV